MKGWNRKGYKRALGQRNGKKLSRCRRRIQQRKETQEICTLLLCYRYVGEEIQLKEDYCLFKRYVEK